MQNTQSHESQARFEALLATAVDGIIVIDERGVVQVYNPACERLFEYTAAEVIGQNVKMLMPEPYRGDHDGYISNYRTTHKRKIIGIGREVLGRRKSGATFPMYLSVGEGRVDDRSIFVGIIHDTSERVAADRKLQEIQGELLHISRLSEMGQMASALAHELNQPLAAITNYAKAARRTLDKVEGAEPLRARELLDKTAAQALRAGEIIRRLREFTEKADSNRTRENVNGLIEEAIGLGIVGTAEADVKIRVELYPELPPIFVDKIQVQQVVLNLVRNSIEAMVGWPRRELTISTAPDADFILITISDTGPGLAPEVQEKLFQPFVTTKTQGMGIGLSICRSIIDAHGGRLWATPNEGGGVAFRFRLPAGGESHGK
jgi:two-component system sensor kinase FixL